MPFSEYLSEKRKRDEAQGGPLTLLEQLGEILEPTYELPGLSSYTRAMGKLGKILDAPTKKRKSLLEEAGLGGTVDPMYGGFMLGTEGVPGEMSGQPTAEGMLPMLAPASGDPETGKYSPLDVGFAIADVASLGATKPVKNIARKVLDDFSAIAEHAKIRKMEKQMAKIEADAPGTLSEAEDAPLPWEPTESQDIYTEEWEFIEGSNPDPETAFSPEAQEMMAELDELQAQFNAQSTTPSSTGLDDAPIEVRKQQLIDEGSFKSTNNPDFEHLELIALEERLNKGVEVFPAKGGKYQSMNIEELPEDVGLIVQRRKNVNKQEIDRDIVIGRKDFMGDSTFTITSVDPNTNLPQGSFKFSLSSYDNFYSGGGDPRYAGKKVVNHIMWFSGVGNVNKVVQKMHNGRMLSDFISFALKNDWVIMERSMTLDSLYALLHQSIKQKAQIIFDASKRGTQYPSSGGGHSVWSKLSQSVLVDEKGDFVGEGVDKVLRDLERMIENARSKGRVSGEAGFEVTSELRPAAPAQMTREGQKIIRAEIEAKFPELKVDKEGRKKLKELREIEIKKIEQESIHHRTTDVGKEIAYNAITIKKFGGFVASALGLDSVEEFQEFLNYNPESMEAQVFDNEQLF